MLFDITPNIMIERIIDIILSHGVRMTNKITYIIHTHPVLRNDINNTL